MTSADLQHVKKELIEAVTEQVMKMQESNGTTTSRLVYDLDKKFSVEFAILKEQGKELIACQKRTDERVGKVEVKTEKMVEQARGEHTKMIDAFTEANKKIADSLNKKIEAQHKKFYFSLAGSFIFLASLQVPTIKELVTKLVSSFI